MRTYVLVIAAVVTLALPVACGQGQTDRSQQQFQRPGSQEISAADFDPAHFHNSADIDNRWMPLTPGTKLVFSGATTEDDERIPHRLVSVVTDLTKVVDGVQSTVIWERDFSEGKLAEAELALFAQDDAGNVWLLGEYPEEYEHGKLDAAPTWVQGIQGARAGIAMRAEPTLGESDYSEGYAPPPVDFVDRARTYRTGERTCVPTGCYDDVLVTEEFEVGKPDAFQLKYYAPGVGNVRVGWRGAEEEDHEVLELTERTHLGAQQVAAARDAALQFEARAYRVSKDVYGLTSPARTRGD